MARSPESIRDKVTFSVYRNKTLSDTKDLVASFRKNAILRSLLIALPRPILVRKPLAGFPGELNGYEFASRCSVCVVESVSPPKGSSSVSATPFAGPMGAPP
jgi:hypothetical protein